MSSILDALNKLEEEKKKAARTAAEAAIDPRVAARELVGRAPGRRPQGHPLIWGLAGIAVFFMVTLCAAVAAYFILKPSLQNPTLAAVAPIDTTAPTQAEAVTPAAEEAAPASLAEPSAAAAEAKPEPAPAKPQVAAQAPAPAPADTPVNADKPKPAANAAPLPKPFDVASNSLPELGWVGASATTTGPNGEVIANDVARPAPDPRVDVAPLPAPTPAPPAPVSAPPATAPTVAAPPVAATPVTTTPVTAPPVAATPQPAPAPPAATPGPMPTDISKLPILRESDKPRAGFTDVNINMLQPRSESRPYARAIINLKPVMIGEIIPGTRATLIGVEPSGIAIEVNGSRERYFVPFGFGI